VEKNGAGPRCSLADLCVTPRFGKKSPHAVVTAQAGLPTLLDILSELAKPGRDPRKSFESFAFAQGIEKLTDLVIGMKLPGIVTNVTAFGAFVDIGVHRDGLVHVSELSDNFVKDPRQVVQVRQKVSVTVLEVDQERGRVSLSMKSSPAPVIGKSGNRESFASGAGHVKRGRAEKKGAFNNPFEKAFKKP